MPIKKRSTRAKPGSTGEGEYFHIEVRSRTQFTSFRTQDVGDKGHLQRVAGRRSSGSWADQKWLVSKQDAHLRGDNLVPDSTDAKELFRTFGSKPVRTTGDRFKARPRPNVPEAKKPTLAQRKARSANIKKAQASRRTPN